MKAPIASRQIRVSSGIVPPPPTKIMTCMKDSGVFVVSTYHLGTSFFFCAAMHSHHSLG